MGSRHVMQKFIHRNKTRNAEIHSWDQDT